ncbi:MAG: YfbM family protein [Gammaproteobacteria bacterium]|nr:YfbM family protein [Gammaproteobacteria bacterium]
MGMCLALHSVSDKNIANILASPALIWRLLAAEDPEIYIETVKENSAGFFARLFGKKNTDTEIVVPDLDFVEGENIDDDLDKSWHGIHYCLNKTEYEAEPPMDFITLGGETVGDIEVGYGPARLLNSETVREIHQRLLKITTEQLHQNYDPDEMNKLDIYPNIWVRDDEEGFEYIEDYFENLKTFTANCVKHKLGMAVYLS